MVLFLTMACSGDPSEAAGETARLYYQYLLDGKYDDFVDGFYRPDSIPHTYRASLIENAQMYMYQQEQERKGVSDVKVVRAYADTALHAAHVFLLLTYKDSTTEEIVVPMVEEKGKWYMR